MEPKKKVNIFSSIWNWEPKSEVNINWQTLFIFIPFLSFYAVLRIEKVMRASAIFVPINIGLGFLFGLLESFHPQDQIQGIILIVIIFSTLGVYIWYCIHFIRHWSRVWNEKIRRQTTGN